MSTPASSSKTGAASSSFVRVFLSIFPAEAGATLAGSPGKKALSSNSEGRNQI